MRSFLSNPTINIQPVDGSPVIYPFVTEYVTDGTNPLGKTEYRYTGDLDEVTSIVANCSKPAVVSTFYARGHLRDKKVYKSVPGGTFQPVAEEINTYNTSAFAWQSNLGGFLVDQIQVAEGIPGNPYPLGATNEIWQYNNYNLTADDNYLTSSIEKAYNATDSTKYVTTSSGFDDGRGAEQLQAGERADRSGQGEQVERDNSLK